MAEQVNHQLDDTQHTESSHNNTEVSTNDDKQQTTEKTFTQEEVTKLIQERVAREQRKTDEKIKDAIAEAQKLAKMNKDQQLQYENDKLLKELETYKTKDAKSQMKQEARSMLNQTGIEVVDEDLLDILVTENAEQTKKNVDIFANLLNKMVQANVEKALRQETPVNYQQSSLSKQDIMAIKDDVERQQAIAKNINLFK
ncbi:MULTISPECIES: DUF4355 domain-containing protein [Staphylococcus]|jgi:hypothetical protein|uniref:DUF4355 domain-containing protein n=1 Tax=Staphylococcus TaxID=1279 RepID=UPI00026BFB8A|nr:MULTISPECIES: DUF4355 domain-containing protein [Staphylococcus]EJD81833.1 hypothetical protein HMPREF9994_02274 [Staphylococcus epidermidis NIHLM088]EJD88544.1 hypothetical protein HMPREF9992_02257 [Staphylococcus epidermidis NIHLM070]DAT89529.1 MAG TPA: capsid scaffolding protein [Caudoviricetes sp.]EJE23145.1 hypothetical protein HMPREF9976_05886 [Staphylococcus epidermidis NIHLM003]KPH57192.1 hypothetical protein ADT70_10730 [Staphylococcus epidermidis]